MKDTSCRVLLLPVVVISCAATIVGQNLSKAQKECINALISSQLEATLKSDEGIRKQGEAIVNTMKFNLEVLNRRLRGAGLPNATMDQYTCADSFATYSYKIVIKTTPACRKLPAYITKAYKNLALTSAEQKEQDRLQQANDAASKETKFWLDKMKEFSSANLESGVYKPVPGPKLLELYRSLFTNIDSNLYKIDFGIMEIAPKSKNEYLEKPFDVFWKGIGNEVRRRVDLERQKVKLQSRRQPHKTS